MMRYRLAVDTGGTFTDVVAVDGDGRLWMSKAPTTPERISDGIFEALRVGASEQGASLEEILSTTDLFIYGTTAATNALITGRTARTAFLVTEGFPHILLLREGGKAQPFDFRGAYPSAYVSQRHTFEMQERINSEGEVVVPLDEEQVRHVLRHVKELDIEAIAVCFLWSVVNPTHEEVVGALIEEELAGVPYTLSSHLNPIIREYRRASSAAIDASLKPLMEEHLNGIRSDLRRAGFDGELLVVTSSGGVLGVEDVLSRPVYLVGSGPAMAPVAGQTYSGDSGSVIVCDTGGTSFDVSVIVDGKIQFTREAWIGEQFTGHITGLASVDVRSIGAGGGSIAWIDAGGLLRVGPQSAGAVPGPVCYGRGGTEPTVTDAAVVLGYIDPTYFLGGRIPLDRERAAAAVAEKIASRLVMDVSRAAYAILAVANEHMVTAIQNITVDQGLDPREAVIVAGGGASGLTIAPIAAELGCRTVLIPRVAAALSASGGQFSDVVAEFSASHRVDTNRFDSAAVNSRLAKLTEDMDAFLARMATNGGASRKEFSVEARYPYQVWELEVALGKGEFESEADIEAMVAAFHDVHERVFAVKEPGQYIECLYWKGRAVHVISKPTLHQYAPASDDPEPSKFRIASFGPDGEAEVPCYLGISLLPGHIIPGPAIVEEPNTTIVVYRDWSLSVTETGDYRLDHV